MLVFFIAQKHQVFSIEKSAICRGVEKMIKDGGSMIGDVFSIEERNRKKGCVPPKYPEGCVTRPK